MRTGRPRSGLGGIVACPACGKETYRYPSTMGRKFCGISCRDTAKKAKRVRDGEARCARCREWKPLANFVRGSKGIPHSYCKPCSSQWFHERRGTPVEARKPYREAFLLTPEQKKRNVLESSRRNHLRRRAAGTPPPMTDIGRMLCMQDARCIYCRVLLEKYHIDHILPVSRGGTNDLGNLQLLCPRCNISKNAMTHEEFLVSKRRVLPRRIRE